ncbi:MAG TPA: ATP-binding protein [Anaerolineales bacterium]|nr:ATP-binding protein [Anaerolineales bacterium]
MNTQGTSRRKLWLEAEHYHISEIADIYRPHPEGLPSIVRNCLVIGYPGVGKTMILKKLCFDLNQNGNLLPIYIQIEPWVALVAGETTYPTETRQTPREKQLLTCTSILLALGIIDRLQKHADYSIVRSATSMFPSDAPPEHDFDAWMNRELAKVRNVLEYGNSLGQAGGM